ncbi:MAG: hypothetical protein GY940_26945, partial [bacterium]|nr:hypothetical protein [bacterium]
LNEDQEITINVIFRGLGTITGTVLDHESNPLLDIVVYIDDTNYLDTTGETGEFRLENVPVGSYTIRAYHQAAKKQIQKSLTLANEGDEVSAVLVFPDTTPKTGAISGIVRDVGGGSPVPYVDIYISDGNYVVLAHTKTGGDGRFLAAGLPIGRLFIIAVRGEQDYAMGSTTIITAGYTADSDITLRGRGTVKINVYGPDGVTGVQTNIQLTYPKFEFKPGNYIGFRNINTTFINDINGYREITNITEGNFNVKAWSGLYPKPSYKPGTLAANSQAHVSLVMTESIISEGDVKVHVTSPDGAPVYNAEV